VKILTQLGWIFAFALAGAVIGAVLPVQVPASVMGLILLLIALRLGWLQPRHLGETADFLSAIMAFFFIPQVVALAAQFDVIRPFWWKILVVVVVSTFVTFGATYGVMHGVQRLLTRWKA
jgi:holin-like protein